VSGVRVDRISGARIHWSSQAMTAGPGVSYDVATGSLSAVLANQTFAAASCLGTLTGTSIDDPTAPALGQVLYYLIRAHNSCSAGSYGNSSLLPDPRDGLDGSTVCSPNFTRTKEKPKPSPRGAKLGVVSPE
jgi:hypothetical protein